MVFELKPFTSMVTASNGPVINTRDLVAIRSLERVLELMMYQQATKNIYRQLINIFCLACLLSQFPAAFGNEKTLSDTEADWYYTYRPSDSMPQVGKRFLNPKYKWPDLVRYNDIEDPASLQPGSIIKIPIAWLKFQPRPAKTLSVDGNVLVKKDQFGQFSLLKANSSIHVGYEVMSRKGTALIKLADNSIIRVEPDTHITFNRLSHFGDTGMVDTRIRLKRGGMINTVAPLLKGSRFEIRTPSAVAAVRGTVFRLRTNTDGTQIEVTEGEVSFGHEHGMQTIQAGEGASVSAQSALMDKRKLYEAPKRQFASSDIQDLPVTLSWDPVPGAKSYKYELTVKDENGAMVRSKQVNKPAVEINHVTSGNYQLAMRAIDSDGFEGLNDSASVAVELDGDTPAPLFPLADSVINSEDLKFDWELEEENSSKSKLQVSKNMNFSELVVDQKFTSNSQADMRDKLDPGVYYWRVVGLSDQHIESASDARKVSVRGLMKQANILSVNYVKSQVGLFWTAIPEANGYILQISDSPNFLSILREESLQKPSAFLKLNPGKHYYARIKGIPNDLYQSEFGPSKKLFIPENSVK